jgi:hypothetical protein
MTTRGPHLVVGIATGADESGPRGFETILGASHTPYTPNHSAGTADSEGVLRHTLLDGLDKSNIQ